MYKLVREVKGRELEEMGKRKGTKFGRNCVKGVQGGKGKINRRKGRERKEVWEGLKRFEWGLYGKEEGKE